MASYYTPKTYKPHSEYQSTGVHNSLKKNSSIKNLSSVRNSMNELIKGVDSKRLTSYQGISEVIDTNKKIIETLTSGGSRDHKNPETQLSIDLGYNENYNQNALSKSVYAADSKSNYIEQLESENRELKMKLSQEVDRNYILVSKLKEEGIPVPRNAVTSMRSSGQDSDTAMENRSLKQQVLKQNNDLSKLYYELEMLKNSNDKIRKDTIKMISKNKAR